MSGDAPLDRDEFQRWRAEADRALTAARVQAAADLHNWACFAAEQAAQLALKAALHGIGSPPWGHDLVRLAEALDHEGLAVPREVAEALRRLSRHYIPARYPDAHPSGPAADHYGDSDAAAALADAEATLAFVDRSWEALDG